MTPKMSSTPTAADARGDALKALLIEVTLTHFHVAAVSRAIAGPSDLTNGQVSLLRSIARGPCTVPELASERAIARQPVQRMVLELESMGLVRMKPNPRHKRSRLAALTVAGRRRLEAMERRQSRWAAGFAADLPLRELSRAAELLRELRESLAEHAPRRGDAT